MNRRQFLLAFLLLPLAAGAQTQRKGAGPVSRPAEEAHVYRNPTFAFRFKIPYGWVDRTNEMREQQAPEKPDATTEKPDARDNRSKENASAKGEVLLAIFERPPDAIGDTINSAVVIVSESAAAFPGLKKAEDYIGPLTGLTTSKGFKVEGDPSVLEIDSRQLVCVDFSKPLNDKLTMRQSTLILLAKGRIVSFTFIAGSQDEVDELIERISFEAGRK